MAIVGGLISPGDAYVRIDPEALAAYVRDGGGPVVADLERRASAWQAGARAQVGKRTRRLERSIVKRAGVDEQGPFVLLVTEGVRYGLMHHEGTRPHVIVPVRRKALRWPAAGAPGGVRFAKRVNHPGTTANRYFTNTMHLAGR